MTLLLDEIEVLETSGHPADADVRGVEHDSRRVSSGDLFCCLVGERDDGHDHVPEAVGRGAVGVLFERPVPGLPEGVVQVRVAPGGGRRAMARAATAFWGHPARSLVMAGVTGTNGKTTVAHLLGAVLERAGHPTTVVGTLTGARTTPESTELQRTLADVRDTHPPLPRPAVAMEVSSHALVQSRVEGICYDVAVFTNLSHEHLDFHHSMEEYFEAKAILFDSARAKTAIVQADDPWGRRLLERISVPAVEVHDDEVTGVRLAVGRSVFSWRGRQVSIALTGALNVRNAHLAAEAAVALGVPPDVVAEGLGAAPPVPGRMEPVGVAGEGGADVDVLVDYAHTPAALETVLDEANRLARPRGGRTVVVFGCGGDRDASKRPVMGQIASRLADVAVVTSDNPRSENPETIIDQILAGVGEDVDVVVEPDRGVAIVDAIRSALPGDVVVVAGKGHEATQTVGAHVLPFDDRRAARDALASRAGGGGAAGSGAAGSAVQGD
ncbi:MAG: UDP-N-acetylmuramoyl-L-alanyl-D-glutamate--2,6-diaminopimelate ligase [Acidimicrobiales bacterium]